MLNVRQLLEATDGTLLSGAETGLFRAISTDTRTIQPGDLYVPLTGGQFDGHDFVVQALEKGAAGFLWVEDRPDPEFSWPESTVVVTVKDTLTAYQDMARYWRRLVNCVVVGITGSSGKTSTKEFVAEALRRSWRVLKTDANLNNEIGVPKTLLELRPGDQVAVIEMGMRGPGQIKDLCGIAEPDYGVIVNVGPAHLSELGSMEAVANAKWELADWLKDHDGRLVINGDNSYLRELAVAFPAERLHRVSTVPTTDWADLVAVEQMQVDGRQAFRYRDQEGIERRATISLQGEHQVGNALLAICLAKVMGAGLPKDWAILPSPLAGRGEEIDLGQVTFVNEAYNANPASMQATLETFAKRSGGRKIAVLGEMRELGPTSAELHREIGALVAKLDLDVLVTIGGAARDYAAGAMAEGFPVQRIRQYDSAVATAEALASELQVGDRVLLKASRGARLEDVLIELRSRWEA